MTEDARDTRIASLVAELDELATEAKERIETQDERICELEKDITFAGVRAVAAHGLATDRERLQERIRSLEAEAATLREASEHGVYMICSEHRLLMSPNKRMACPVCKLEAEVGRLRTTRTYASLRAEVERLQGKWVEAGDLCPQCGTGNPKLAALRAKLAKAEEAREAMETRMKWTVRAHAKQSVELADALRGEEGKT